MDRGFLKLWRKSLESDVFQCPNLWRTWSWCLMKTTYKKRTAPLRVGRGIILVKLNPGEFIFGRNKAAYFLNESPSTIWKRMKKLENLGCIKIKSNNQYSIVSICNWGDYQAEKPTSEQPSNNQVTTKEQLSNTNKKDNNVNKENKTTQKFNPQSIRPEWITEEDWNDVIDHRKKHPKKPVQTERAYRGLIKQFKIAMEKGFTISDCVDRITTSSWQSFNADWMKQEDMTESSTSMNCNKCYYKVIEKLNCWEERSECGSFRALEGR